MQTLHSENETVWFGVIGPYVFEESYQIIFANSESYYTRIFLAMELAKDEKCMVSVGWCIAIAARKIMVFLRGIYPGLLLL